MYAIIVSTSDPAGINIKQHLVKMGFSKTKEAFEDEAVYAKGSMRLYTTQKRSIYCEHIDERIDCDTIIFATTHRSAAGTHSLSVHVPGNYGKAELGGEERQLCKVPASLIRSMYLNLLKNGEGLGYEITLESTHHGPFVEKPCMFIEIGSSEEQWRDEKAGLAIAKTIIDAVDLVKPSPAVIVFGGGHYNQVANKLLTRTDYAVGHICPKYALDVLDEEMLEQMITRSVEKPEIVVLDWKGLGDKKEKVKGLLESCDVKSERSNNLWKEE